MDQCGPHQSQLVPLEVAAPGAPAPLQYVIKEFRVASTGANSKTCVCRFPVVSLGMSHMLYLKMARGGQNVPLLSLFHTCS